jgi:predicted phosphodiesterase
MRLAVISDVHADIHALRDALAQAQRLGYKQTICAGDIVGYGRFPEEAVGLIGGRGIPARAATTIAGRQTRRWPGS